MWIEELGIEARQGNSKHLCPSCTPIRKNKRDRSLSITVKDNGAVWNCHNCEMKGHQGDGSMAGKQGDRDRDRNEVRNRTRWGMDKNPLPKKRRNSECEIPQDVGESSQTRSRW